MQQTAVLVSSLEGGKGLYHHQVTWGKQMLLPKMAFPQDTENLQ